MRKFITSMVVVSLVCCFSGCAMFRRSITDKDPEKASTITSRFDQRDLLTWGKLVTEDILKDPLFVKAGTKKPLAVAMGIQNNTKSHMESQALSDTIVTGLLNSGKMRFINSAQRDNMLKEKGYQLKNCSRSERVKFGAELGAKYILTGTLAEISQQSGREVRVKKTKDIYYQLTIQLTDLETGEIVISKQRDRLRRESQPLIGW